MELEEINKGKGVIDIKQPQKIYIQEQKPYIDTGIQCSIFYPGKKIINDTGKMCIIGIVLCSVALIVVEITM